MFTIEEFVFYLCVGHMTSNISFNFLWKVSGNAEKSREILVRGLESAPLSKPLLEVLPFFLPVALSLAFTYLSHFHILK